MNKPTQKRSNPLTDIKNKLNVIQEQLDACLKDQNTNRQEIRTLITKLKAENTQNRQKSETGALYETRDVIKGELDELERLLSDKQRELKMIAEDQKELREKAAAQSKAFGFKSSENLIEELMKVNNLMEQKQSARDWSKLNKRKEDLMKKQKMMGSLSIVSEQQQTLSEKYKTQKLEIEDLRGKIDERYNELRELSAHLKDLKQIKEKKTPLIIDLENKLDALKLNGETLNQKFSDLQKEKHGLMEKKNELRKKQEEIIKKKQEEETQRKKVMQLENDLKGLTGHKTSTESTILGLIGEAKSLKRFNSLNLAFVAELSRFGLKVPRNEEEAKILVDKLVSLQAKYKEEEAKEQKKEEEKSKALMEALREEKMKYESMRKRKEENGGAVNVGL